jgi:hypothetical protein
MEELTYNNCLFAARNILEALKSVEESWSCLAGDMAMRLHGVRGRDVKVGIMYSKRTNSLLIRV